MNINEIMEYLPHRYPFLLCDKILSIDYGKSAIGLKNVTYNEPYFPGHFPDEPIMPGVLVLESMAQIGGFVFCDMSQEEKVQLKALIARYDKVKFIKKVIPGDTMIVEATFLEKINSFRKVMAVAKVNNMKVASAEITYKFDD